MRSGPYPLHCQRRGRVHFGSGVPHNEHTPTSVEGSGKEPGGRRIGQFRVRCRRFRYAAETSPLGTALMRHFSPPPFTRPLPGGMTMRSPARTLIARCGPTPRLAPADPRTLTPTINVAVIATLADPHLHRTTPAVVEPIGRLAQPPQCPSQNTGQCSGKAGIKDLHKRLSQALRTEGSGLEANQIPGLRLFAYLLAA